MEIYETIIIAKKYSMEIYDTTFIAPENNTSKLMIQLDKPAKIIM